MNEAVTEEEQIQAIKNWWKENGTQVLIAGCLVAISYFGYQWWQNRQESQMNDVSLAYEEYIEAISEASSAVPATDPQIKTLGYLTDQLVDNHGSSHYAFLASLNTAAFHVRRGELEEAAVRLEWAQDHADAEADQQLVNYRYALVKAQQGSTDDALAMLSGANEQFSSIYAEARGDIKLSIGDQSGALADYELARDSAAPEEFGRVQSLQVKIDSLQNGPIAAVSESE